MKMRIESTDQITKVGRVEFRVWKGITEQGTPCTLFIHRIAVALAEDRADFDRELEEKLIPGTFIDLRRVMNRGGAR